MKIKLLPLVLVVTGIIIISGCIDKEEQQPSSSKAPDKLYRNIFYPYSGNPDNRNPHAPEILSPGLLQPSSESVYDITNATALLDSNIQKAEIISKKLEAGIQRQKAEGTNVSKVEPLLDKYKLLVEEAKKYRALADEASAEDNKSSAVDSDSGDGSSWNLKKKHLIESQNCMIQASGVLREIFEELHHLMPGSEELNNASHLKAAGDGMVNLMGSLTVNLHLEEGEIAIPILSQDSQIFIKGNYTFEEKTDRQGKLRLYRIYSADVNISGSRKAVMLRGQNITLTADGQGYAVFLGNGTYSIEDTGEIKKAQNWSHPLFREDNYHGEQEPPVSGDFGPAGPGEHKTTGPGERPEGPEEPADPKSLAPAEKFRG